MTPIAEVPTPEQASEISNVRYKLAKSPDIEVVGESDTRYRLAGTTTTEDADVKGTLEVLINFLSKLSIRCSASR